MNYNNKKFKAVQNSTSGEVSDEMIFHYKQEGDVLTCQYAGKYIIYGHLLGLVDDVGRITMSYHQVNTKGELRSGTCISSPEIMPNGKIRLKESWQWTTGDGSKGHSILEEV